MLEVLQIRYQTAEVQSRLQACQEAVQGRRQAGQSQRDAPPQQGRDQLGERRNEVLVGLSVCILFDSLE